MTNHYAILDVHRQSTDEEIKHAYYRQAMQHHPDHCGGTHAAMVLVAAAYAALRTAAKRAAYNALLDLACTPCPACSGAGVVRKQKGFTAVVLTTCKACCGAGCSVPAR